MMIPGVDFTERLSSVATYESLNTQITSNLKNYQKGWRTESCDIESEMDNNMYIEPYPAMVE